MTQDETRGPRGWSSEGPDPSFVRRMEDDSPWADEDTAQFERREDYYPSYSNRRVDRRTARSRHQRDSGYGRRTKSQVPRRRHIAVLVLVAAAIVILIAGLELSDSGNSTGRGSTPFSVLPLDKSAITATSSTTPTTAPTTSTGTP